MRLVQPVHRHTPLRGEGGRVRDGTRSGDQVEGPAGRLADRGAKGPGWADQSSARGAESRGGRLRASGAGFWSRAWARRSRGRQGLPRALSDRRFTWLGGASRALLDREGPRPTSLSYCAYPDRCRPGRASRRVLWSSFAPKRVSTFRCRRGYRGVAAGAGLCGNGIIPDMTGSVSRTRGSGRPGRPAPWLHPAAAVAPFLGLRQRTAALSTGGSQVYA